MPAHAALHIKRDAARRVREGHLWVNRQDVARVRSSYENGDVVDVVDLGGAFLGRGVVNDRSHLMARIWTLDDEPVDEALLVRRLDAALALRRALGVEGEVMRLCNSEGDLLPGLTIDRYGDHVVVLIQSLGLTRFQPGLARWLEERFPGLLVYERGESRGRALEGLPAKSGYWGARGDQPPLPIRVRTPGGLTMAFDVGEGQKTGGFLDQLENQRWLASFARGRRVLDAFSGDGGFGLSALAAGAERVLFLDASERSLEHVKQNLADNGLGERADLLRMNAFDALRSFDRQGARFDLVILDPPAFTKSRAHLDEAYRGYKEINLRALKLLGESGLIFTCSCSYHVSRDMFREMLVSAASDAHRLLRVVEERSASRDHPELLGMPETRYLKCLLGYVA